MNVKQSLGFALLAATLGTSAYADNMDGGLTRQQVQAETAQAQHDGTIVDARSGKMLRDLYPGQYPAAPATVGKTRDEVKAELAEAIRTGNIQSDRSGRTLREEFPGKYPAQMSDSGKTRDEVKAELAGAQRSGALPMSYRG